MGSVLGGGWMHAMVIVWQTRHGWLEAQSEHLHKFMRLWKFEWKSYWEECTICTRKSSKRNLACSHDSSDKTRGLSGYILSTIISSKTDHSILTGHCYVYWRDIQHRQQYKAKIFAQLLGPRIKHWYAAGAGVGSLTRPIGCRRVERYPKDSNIKSRFSLN